ncbi:hypothetical protein [Cylindrospermopsis raciborskii]|uniref:Uncharacterized protein n=1 Tax=Cylindrospermopsis raciborskii CENA302 TaxID=1170768 RepID=A0A9Q5QUQ2_9CYAN|nr:hypothetical protein [Cylindrospermopsis raciborskii]NLQ06137.1 hypothetical protein [Cylindrospermopsis raciborskii MVCC19]OHY32440.1 hypothetical protein BCV64_13325 [Cylindrospermopsis raciborskii MVCC14]OPH08642.1 hypothetical protein CENA302_14010 [Cylindrospermopsis raciborskii CENA302]
MNELTKSDLRERLGNIDQIRDVLIGPHLREYNNRLEQLERGLASVQYELRNRGEETRQTILLELNATADLLEKKIRNLIIKDEEEKFNLNQQIDNINKRILAATQELQDSVTAELDELAENADKRFKSIQTKDEEEKSEIRQQLDLVNKRLGGSIETVSQTFQQQTKTLQENLQATRNKFQDEITELRAQTIEELERYSSILTQEKVSKDDMAELLFELGLRLQGKEFVPELQQVAIFTEELQTIITDTTESPDQSAKDLIPENPPEPEPKVPSNNPPRAKVEGSTPRRTRTSRLKG